MSGREEKVQNFRRGLLDADNANMPIYCKKCNGLMIFKGVGEYKCEDCGYLDYDDYGKVRNYVEAHPGATSAEVSTETGVSQKAIRVMLKEERLEIAANSSVFLKCEICGEKIFSGRFCKKCEVSYHRSIEEKARADRNPSLSGHSTERPKGEEGAMRFKKGF